MRRGLQAATWTSLRPVSTPATDETDRADPDTSTLHALYFSLPIFWGSREQELLSARICRIMMKYEGLDDFVAKPKDAKDGLQFVPSVDTTVAQHMLRRRRTKTQNPKKEAPMVVQNERTDLEVVPHRPAVQAGGSSSVVLADLPRKTRRDALEEAESHLNLYTTQSRLCKLPIGSRTSLWLNAQARSSLDSIDPMLVPRHGFVSPPPSKAMSKADARDLQRSFARPTRRLGAAERRKLQGIISEIRKAHKEGFCPNRKLRGWLSALLLYPTTDLSNYLYNAGVLTRANFSAGENETSISTLLMSSGGEYSCGGGSATGLAVAEGLLSWALTSASVAYEVVELVSLGASFGISIPGDILAAKISQLSSEGGPFVTEYVLHVLPFLSGELSDPCGPRDRKKKRKETKQVSLELALTQMFAPSIREDILALVAALPKRKAEDRTARWSESDRRAVSSFLPFLLGQVVSQSSDGRAAIGLFLVYALCRRSEMPLPPTGSDKVLQTLLRGLRKRQVVLSTHETLEATFACWSREMLRDLLCADACTPNNAILAVRALRGHHERHAIISENLLVALLEEKFCHSRLGWDFINEMQRTSATGPMISSEKVLALQTASEAKPAAAGLQKSGSKLQRARK